MMVGWKLCGLTKIYTCMSFNLSTDLSAYLNILVVLCLFSNCGFYIQDFLLKCICAITKYIHQVYEVLTLRQSTKCQHMKYVAYSKKTVFSTWNNKQSDNFKTILEKYTISSQTFILYAYYPSLPLYLTPSFPL